MVERNKQRRGGMMGICVKPIGMSEEDKYLEFTKVLRRLIQEVSVFLEDLDPNCRLYFPVKATIASLESCIIMTQKNFSYGDCWRKRKWIGMFINMCRKWDRLETLTRTSTESSKEGSDETIKDTLLDLSNYCMLSVSWIDECKKRGVDPYEKSW
jgi:hypothetical protein